MQGYEEGDERFAKPDAGRDDSLVISYHGKTHTVALAKQMSPWVVLDPLSYGPGFVIDDMSRWWYSYVPVYVHVDSTGKDFNLSSQNWLGEQTGSTRPLLLLMGGYGVESHPGDPSIFSLLFGLQIKSQGGIGVDFNKMTEVFYLAQDESEFDLEPGSTFLGMHEYGNRAEITSQSIAARFFLPKTNDFFVQSSFGWARATGDTLGLGSSDNHFPVVSNSFPVIGVGIGWAGDISFLALQYTLATHRFSVIGYDGVLFHSLYLDFGLNLRF